MEGFLLLEAMEGLFHCDVVPGVDVVRVEPEVPVGDAALRLRGIGFAKR